ncbi:helix-turn-helix domain-containing protein [Pseudoclavibacter sp. 8L]|uniref:helix-turn-helix domain-containing protein n=1 Tax=Pseudoclavibacter sp. 8L TaxID=2653162 RepID=UPI00135AFEA0
MEIKRDSSVEEWEAALGAQVRRARLIEDVDQASLAERANVSVGALANLEHGRGARVQTLIRVCRALGREDWLASLEPERARSPLALARAQERSHEPRRASNRRRL